MDLQTKDSVVIRLQFCRGNQEISDCVWSLFDPHALHRSPVRQHALGIFDG